MTDLINQLIKYEAAYRKAPTTPGLLIIILFIKKLNSLDLF